MWQKVRLCTPPSLVGAACASHSSVSSLLWAGAGQRWEAGSGIYFQCHDNQFESNNGAKGFFFGVHLSLFNWLPFTEFAIWFIFPLTAQPWMAPALKAHHLVPHFNWMILILRGIRKMLDQWLESRECQLCVLFLLEFLDLRFITVLLFTAWSWYLNWPRG